MEHGPYVIAVASEKGGVGKTTIATNLAVYLKALHEDLPVTIASFDNHFSVDNMFAIGGCRGTSVAGLFAGQLPEELATLGEYGVAFLASERSLPIADDPLLLRRLLSASQLPGILVLDTRPILDTATRGAVLAADLVLTPIKDRASLVNAAALQAVLAEAEGGSQRLWLMPSLIDGRLRLRGDLGMREFLVYAARERGYQVFAPGITKSPKVESLATHFTSRIYPILTHARSTRVHGEFRALAEFVLEQLAALPGSQARRAPLASGQGRRLFTGNCPACGGPAPAVGHFYQALRTHKRGFLHEACLARLLGDDEEGAAAAEEAVLRAILVGAEEPTASLYTFGADGEALAERPLNDPGARRWREFAAHLHALSGGEFYREALLIAVQPEPARHGQDRAWRRRFAALRRRVLASLVGIAR